jgi:hypothetical protein
MCNSTRKPASDDDNKTAMIISNKKRRKYLRGLGRLHRASLSFSFSCEDSSNDDIFNWIDNDVNSSNDNETTIRIPDTTLSPANINDKNSSNDVCDSKDDDEDVLIDIDVDWILHDSDPTYYEEMLSLLAEEGVDNNNDQQNKIMKKGSRIIICDQFVQNNCTTYESHRIISSTERPMYSTSSHGAGRGRDHGRISYSTGILEGLEHLNKANIISANSRNVLLNCRMMKLNKNQ